MITMDKQVWSATRTPASPEGADRFLSTIHGIALTGFSHQNRLVDALRDGPMPDVLVLDYQFPGSLDPLTYLQLVREAAPLLRMVYLLPEAEADALLPQLHQFQIYDVLTHPVHLTELTHRIFQAPFPHGADRLLYPTPTQPLAPPSGSEPASRVIETKVVGFWSPGGVGSTTLTANVAAYLAGDSSIQVAAVDFNLATPNLALMLHLLENRNPYQHCLSHLFPALEGRRLAPGVLAGHLLSHPRRPNLKVLPGIFHPSALPRLTAEHCERLLAVLRDTHHLVLVDLPPAIDALTTFITLEQTQQVLLVISPAYPARFHLKRSLLQLQELGWDLERFELILNQAGRISHRQVAYELGLPVAAAVPLLPGLDRWVEREQLPMLSSRSDAALQAFQQGIAGVADRIAPRRQANPGPPRRFAFLRGR